MNTITTEFGKLIRQKRNAAGLTQDDLALKIGCAFETVRKIEAGRRRPSRQMAELIGRALGVKESDLAEFIEQARSSNSGDLFPRSGSTLNGNPDPQTPLHNIPLVPTSFIGRRADMGELQRLLLLEGVRLVTLVGPPGIGKTRLSIEFSRAVQSRMEWGPFFVPLAAVSDHAHIIEAISAALGMNGSIRQSMSSMKQAVFDYLRARRTLLLLDNMEHIKGAAAEVAELLRACPPLQILTTSREPLDLYGEHQYMVRELSHAEMSTANERAVNVIASPQDQAPPLRSGAYYEQFEAVQLFVQRAKAVDRNFALTEENAHDVARLCWELDGLPLAIELAAAQCKVLNPRTMLTRLSSRLKVLTRGASDLPGRQRTLRGAIDWSYGLLTEEERVLFRRLAVFSDWLVLDAIETVCTLPGEVSRDTLETLSSLLNKSLIKVEKDEEQEERFYMLKTISEYAEALLQESGEEDALRRSHANYYLRLTEDASKAYASPLRENWNARLDIEINNLRGALTWTLANSDDQERAKIGLGIAGALQGFWYLRGHISEGREWLARALAAVRPSESQESKSARARALDAAGRMAMVQSDYAVAFSTLEDAATLWRELGNRHGLAFTLVSLGATVAYRDRHVDSIGPAMIREAIDIFIDIGDRWGQAYALDFMGDAMGLIGRPDNEVATYKKRSLAIYRDIGDKWGIASLLTELGYTELRQEEYVNALSYLEEAVVLARAAGDRRYVAFAVASLAEVVWYMGNPTRAHDLFTESLSLYKSLGDRTGESTALRYLGHLAYREGELHEATSRYRHSLRITRELKSRPGMALMLGVLASLIGAYGKTELSARLLGASVALRKETGAMLPHNDRLQIAYAEDSLRRILGAEQFVEQIEAGKAIPLEEALQWAEDALPV